MILKILSNMNNLINYVVIFIVLLLVTYAIYKIIIIEGDIYMISERLNRIEMDYVSKEEQPTINTMINNDDFNVADILMKEIFTQKTSVCKKEDVSSIDLDNIISSQDTNEMRPSEELKEEIFDLKKEVIADDRESIVSSSVATTKKKLQKMSVDKLKEKCGEMDLSQEGTKAQMIDRIIENTGN